MPRTRRAHAAALAAAALACCAARGVSGALPLTFSHATRNAAGGFFAASDCGASPSVLTLQSLSLSPDPLLLGAPFNYSLAFTVSQLVAAPVQVRACACTASSCAARALTPLSFLARSAGGAAASALRPRAADAAVRAALHRPRRRSFQRRLLHVR